MASVPPIPPGIKSLTDPKFLGWLQDVIDALENVSDKIILPSGDSITTDETGEIALDTNGDGTNVDQATIQLYDGTQNLFFFGVDSYPTDNNDVIHYNSTNKDFEWKQVDLDKALIFSWFGVN